MTTVDGDMVAINNDLRRPGLGGESARMALVHVFYNFKLVQLCLVVGLAIGLTAALFSRTEYTADSLLLVRTDASDTAQQGIAGPVVALAGDAVKRILQSDVQIIESEPVVRAAVMALNTGRPKRQSGLRGIFGRQPELNGPAQISKAMEGFRRKLRVVAEPDSNIIRISFKSADRADAIASVQALVDAYRSRRAGMYINGSMELQGQYLAQYRQDIAGIEGQIAQIRSQSSVLDLTQDITAAGARLEGVEQRLTQARERLGGLGAELAATEETLKRSPGQVFASREASNAVANDDTRNTLLRLRQEREHVAAQYAPGWPGLAELDRKIAAAQAAVAANATDRTQTEVLVRNPVLDTLNGGVARLTIERRALQSQLVELARERAEAQARVSQLRGADERLRDLQRTRDVMEGIYKQLSLNQAGTQLLNGSIDDPNNALRVVQPPTAPLKGRNLAMSFILAGLLLGVVGAVVVTAASALLRQVFILPEQAERALGAPILATFGADAADPESPEGRRAVDQLAAVIMDARPGGKPLKVIQLVALGSDGASGLGMAVARVISINSRQRTLIVDFEREERFRRMLTAASTIEKLQVAGFDMEVVRTRAANLWVSLNAGSTGLCSIPTPVDDIRGALADLEKTFARVIIALSRDHAGYPTRRLFPLADANIVIIRGERTRVAAARRLIETILQSGGDVLGIVYTDHRVYVPRGLRQWV